MSEKQNSLDRDFDKNNLAISIRGINEIISELEKICIRCDVRPIVLGLEKVIDNLEQISLKRQFTFNQDIKMARINIRAILRARS